jgi:hypothetical protein
MRIILDFISECQAKKMFLYGQRGWQGEAEPIKKPV